MMKNTVVSPIRFVKYVILLALLMHYVYIWASYGLFEVSFVSSLTISASCCTLTYLQRLEVISNLTEYTLKMEAFWCDVFFSCEKSCNHTHHTNHSL